MGFLKDLNWWYYFSTIFHQPGKVGDLTYSNHPIHRRYSSKSALAPPVSSIKTQIIDVMYLTKGLESWGDLRNTLFILVAKMVIAIMSNWVIHIIKPCKLVAINLTNRLVIQLTTYYHFRHQINTWKRTAGHQKVPYPEAYGFFQGPAVGFFWGVKMVGFWAFFFPTSLMTQKIQSPSQTLQSFWRNRLPVTSFFHRLLLLATSVSRSFERFLETTNFLDFHDPSFSKAISDKTIQQIYSIFYTRWIIKVSKVNYKKKNHTSSTS